MKSNEPSKSVRNATIRRASLFVSGDAGIERAVGTLLALDEPCGTCLSDAPPAIATRSANDPAIPYLVGPLGNRGRPARAITPPSRVKMLVPRPGEMILVDLSRRGSRLGKVAYAKSLFDSEMLFASIDLDKLSGNDPDIAIGLWRPFVWNWARIGRHLGEEGAALTAEIALGIVARRYYLTATVDGFNIAMATADPIVAELAGRAVLQLRSGRRDDLMRAPWEAPIVQRAGELGLGVRTPDQIELISSWSGSGDRSDRFASFVQRFADLLSITIPAGQGRPATIRQ